MRKNMRKLYDVVLDGEYMQFKELKGHYLITLIDENFNLVGEMTFDPSRDIKQQVFDSPREARLIRIEWVPEERTAEQDGSISQAASAGCIKPS